MTVKELREKREKLLAELRSGAVKAERFAEIKEQIAQIDFLITQSEAEERAAAQAEQDAAQRAAHRPGNHANAGGGNPDPALRMLFGGGNHAPAQTETPEERTAAAIANMTKREKVAYIIGKQFRNKEFSEMERRALGSALTTTATEYVAASEAAPGVNNAGVFISVNLLYDFLLEEKILSPIVADINMTSYKGLMKFPYRKSRDKANAKAENARGKDNQMEWAELSDVQGNLQTIIVVSDLVLALSDIDLGEYIIAQIKEDINEDWGQDFIYGSGTDNKIKGITRYATSKTYDSSTSATDAIIAAIKLCKGKFRRNAKIYVAQDVYDSIAFEKDAQGRFMHPILNNKTGIVSFSVLDMAVDENLSEGEFIVGNIKKYFKANAVIPMRLETDRSARFGKTEYIASVYASVAAYPDAFLWYKKTATT